MNSEMRIVNLQFGIVNLQMYVCIIVFPLLRGGSAAPPRKVVRGRDFRAHRP